MDNLPVEREVRAYLEQQRLGHTDNTNSFKRPDFTIWFAEKTPFFLEVKEKRQAYAMEHWPAFAPEDELFILDDLTVRKCLGFAPRSGILMRDNGYTRYHFFSVIDLALMPRLRVDRPIKRNLPDLKGKWLINLRNSFSASTLDGAFIHIRDYLADLPAILYEHHPCYGKYVGEEVGSGGIERNPGHWEIDVQATR